MKVISRFNISTLADLQYALGNIASDAPDRTEIYLTGLTTIALAEETLTDGSKVYNLICEDKPKPIHIHDRACAGPGSFNPCEE